MELEDQLRRELQLPRGVQAIRRGRSRRRFKGCVGNNATVAARRYTGRTTRSANRRIVKRSRINRADVCMVEDIERFSQELQFEILMQGELPHSAEIDLIERRSNENIASKLRRTAASSAAGGGDFAAGDAGIYATRWEATDGYEQRLAAGESTDARK